MCDYVWQCMTMTMTMTMTMILRHFNLWPLSAEGLYWQRLLSGPANSSNLNPCRFLKMKTIQTGLRSIQMDSPQSLRISKNLLFSFALFWEFFGPWWGGWNSPCPLGFLLACLRGRNFHPSLDKVFENSNHFFGLFYTWVLPVKVKTIKVVYLKYSTTITNYCAMHIA